MNEHSALAAGALSTAAVLIVFIVFADFPVTTEALAACASVCDRTGSAVQKVTLDECACYPPPQVSPPPVSP